MFIAWLFSALAMAGLWVLQKKRENAGFVDFGWAAILGFLAVAYAIGFDGHPVRRWLVGILGGGWALRLALHLFFHRIWRTAETPRYQELRAQWREHDDLYFFLYFQVQGLLAVVFSIPFYVATTEKEPLASIWIGLAVGLWLISVGGEAIADIELAKFKANPENRGKTCRTGLWKYSRHPNYFFEWLHWWIYVFLAMGSSNVSIAFLGPFVMFLFLFSITGIPPNEARALRTKGDYRIYQRTTSIFFPWFPKPE